VFDCFADLDPEVAREWLRRLAEVDHGTVAGILDRVPVDRISDVCKEFTLKLLDVNRQRLLDTTK